MLEGKPLIKSDSNTNSQLADVTLDNIESTSESSKNAERLF